MRIEPRRVNKITTRVSNTPEWGMVCELRIQGDELDYSDGNLAVKNLFDKGMMTQVLLDNNGELDYPATIGRLMNSLAEQFDITPKAEGE